MTDNKKEMSYEEYMIKALASLKEVISNIDSKIEVMHKEFIMGYQEPIYLKTNLEISKDSFNRLSDNILTTLTNLIESEKEEVKQEVKETKPAEVKEVKPEEKPKPKKQVFDDFEEDDDDFTFEED